MAPAVITMSRESSYENFQRVEEQYALTPSIEVREVSENLTLVEKVRKIYNINCSSSEFNLSDCYLRNEREFARYNILSCGVSATAATCFLCFCNGPGASAVTIYSSAAGLSHMFATFAYLFDATHTCCFTND